MAPFQIVLKHRPDINQPEPLWSFVKHDYQGRTVDITLINYHIRWKDGTSNEFPQCPLRVDFSSPPGTPEKIEALMFGANVGQSGAQPGEEWNATQYNNLRLGFFIPNGEHGSDPHPGFTSISFSPLRWRARLLDKDVYCSVTHDTNAPWVFTKPNDPGSPSPDITDNIVYIILTFDVALVSAN